MLEYQKQLERCSSPPGDEGAADYFEKYWLSWKELVNDWTPIHKKIFNRTVRGVPEKIFKDGFELKVILGGSVIYEGLFDRLQKCMKETGDEFYVVVEHHDPIYPTLVDVGDKKKTPLEPWRFKYPVSAGFEEVKGGRGIEFNYSGMPMRQYYVFGDSGKWGLYLDLDCSGVPLNVVGVEKEYVEIFKDNFVNDEKQKAMILPQLDDFYSQFV